MPTKASTAAAAAAADIDDDDDAPSLSAVAAVARWRTWAESMSQGGPMPPSRAVLDCATLLDIHDPASRLAADAALIREVRDLEAQAAAIHDQVAAARAEYGGMDGVKAKIREVRTELARLERLDGIHPRSLQAGSLSGQASRIRNSRPDLFERPKAAKPKRRTSR